MSSSGGSFTVDQARGALAWLIGHLQGDDTPGDYPLACEILGDALVNELARVAAARAEWGVRDRLGHVTQYTEDGARRVAAGSGRTFVHRLVTQWREVAS